MQPSKYKEASIAVLTWEEVYENGNVAEQCETSKTWQISRFPFL